jgi:tetratricopeptide (TPR) repeat protein
VAAFSFVLRLNLVAVFLFLLAFGQTSSPLEQGLVALRDGKLAEARIGFQKALDRDPKNAFAWVSMAETCRRLGDSKAASSAADKAEQYGGDVAVVDHALASFYSQEGLFGHAAGLEEKYSASAKADPNAGLRVAELYHLAGNDAKAESVLKALWERRSEDPAAAFAYGQFLLHKLDFIGAEKAVKSALAAHPKDAQLVLAMGVARYGERRFSDAIDDFLKVIAIDPSIPQPYEFIGKMMENAGTKMPQITKAFEARFRSVPDDALANLVLAKARIAVDAKDASAEGLLRHSIAIDGKQWESHYELGALLEGLHEYKAAAEELNRSAELNPKQSMPHYHLARVYDRLGEPEKAQAERKLHEQLSNSNQ